MYNAESGHTILAGAVSQSLGPYVASDESEQRLDLLQHLTTHSRVLLIVAAPSGYGKSTLKMQFLQRATDAQTVYSLDALKRYTAQDLLAMLSQAFGLADIKTATRIPKNVQYFVQQFQTVSSDGLLVIDDAHLLGDSSLQTLLRLLDLQFDCDRYLHVLMFAEPAVVSRIESTMHDIGADLEVHTMTLEPLTLSTTDAYLTQKLEAMGKRSRLPLSSSDVEHFHQKTAGIPAELDRVLETLSEEPTASSWKRRRVSEPVVEIADGAAIAAPWFGSQMLWGLTALVILMAGVVGYQYLSQPLPLAALAEPQQLADAKPPPLLPPVTMTDAAASATLATADTKAHSRANMTFPANQPRPHVPESMVAQMPRRIVPLHAVPSARETAASIASTPVSPAASARSTSPPATKIMKSAASVPPATSAAEKAATSIERAPVKRVLSSTVGVAPPTASAVAPVKLSYNLRDLNDLQQANPEHFTLQLLSVRDPRRLSSYVHAHGLDGKVATIKIRHQGGMPWYVLLMGDYPDRASAMRAIQALPQSLRHHHPWPLQMMILQGEVEELE